MNGSLKYYHKKSYAVAVARQQQQQKITINSNETWAVGCRCSGDGTFFLHFTNDFTSSLRELLLRNFFVPFFMTDS